MGKERQVGSLAGIDIDMKYDDASWHYGGDYPSELPPENGATHIAMFLAWAITRGLVGELHLEDEDSRADVEKVKRRELDPREFVLKWCDEKLTDEDLSEEGNDFAKKYYEGKIYYEDLDQTFTNSGETLYHLENVWPNYDRIFRVIDRRFAEWRNQRT